MQTSKEWSNLNGSWWAILITSGALGVAGCSGVQPSSGQPVSEVETEGSNYAFSTCTPGNRAVCSWMGVCDAVGKACVCDDAQHWWSSDNCSVWHANPPLQPGQVCSPGDPAYCNQMGTCNTAGTGCVCSDPQHWWASEECSIWHQHPDLQPGQVCSPGDDHAYCNWMGTCNATGTGCVCSDPQHWWASERCTTWHAIPQPVVTSCPGYLYLANSTVTADGLQSNGGWPGFLLSASQTTPAGLTCTYSRPPQSGFDVFIGRNLGTGELSATLASANSFLVEMSDETSKTITCPANLPLGPATYYSVTETSGLQPIPAAWAVTQGSTQVVPFAFATTRVYVIECDYSGFAIVSVNIPLL